MRNPTEQQISRLPVWAQEYIKDINRERGTAIGTLNRFVDEQSESNVCYDAFECLGESSGPTTKRKFIQTERINFILGKNSEVQISVAPGSLTVRALQDVLSIEPQSSNTIVISADYR